mmetsp:Transcript_81585/g.141763  ORF Transcript_81585/g.141763 Transcript_81585/m.141763 type:complete len:969 (-) Transcript_81585:182-3088(-)
MRVCKCLAVLLAFGSAVSSAGEAQCKEKEDVSAHSMLNLNMRMYSKVGAVDEREPQVLSPSNLKLDQEASNLSDIAIMKVYNVSDKPGEHSGLPGDVVLTTVTIKCGQAVFSPLGSCPEACPYFAQEAKKYCFFKCVKATDCGTMDPDDRVPDLDMGVCRPCNTRGCKKCAPGNTDTCAQCNRGYSLQPDGTCSSDYMMVWECIITFVAGLMIFLVVWMIQLGCAPITNGEGLQEGLAFRSAVKMHMPLDRSAETASEVHVSRSLYPISTNLHVTQVAGPGLTLHMNFQLASVMWSCIMIVLWISFVYLTDPRQLTIGLLPAETQPELCAVTLQGRTLQEEQMPMKVTFVVLVYLVTFIGTLVYSGVNLRCFESLGDETTMQDFVALATGLPKLPGDQKWEETLKTLFAEKTGEKVVGVSICWDFGDQADEIQDMLEDDLTRRENYPTIEPSEVVDTRPGIQKTLFSGVDSLVGTVLGLSVPDSDEKEEPDEGKIAEMLTSMTSTNSAFVIFETEAARDRAVETTQKVSKGVPLIVDGTAHLLKLKTEVCEPNVVIWENFNVSTSSFAFRLTTGIIGIIVSCIIYALCFYAPYAYYQSMFKFPNEPGAVEGLIFSMLVVAGNQIMYQVCAATADWVGFRFRDRSEGVYVSLYVLAVLLSVVFDMSVEFYLGYHSMADAHVHTADGRSLESLTSYQEIFESYPMQKVLGKRLFDYCFPATFLVPFLVEPLGTIVGPLFVQRLLLRTHPEVRQRNAEKSTECFAPMDLGRYGDILLNLWLAILILFFPSGSTLPILLTYAVSHLYIYCYDQYRILRCVPAFNYSTDDVDKYTQLMLILPCCTLASCVVFKANCTFGDSFCYSGYDVGIACGVAFVVHGLVHLMCIEFFLPAAFGNSHAHVKSEDTYRQVASRTSANWFNTNPINCLRSKYVNKDSPSCCYWMEGKQHLQRKNAKLGLYYENRTKTQSEEF